MNSFHVFSQRTRISVSLRTAFNFTSVLFLKGNFLRNQSKYQMLRKEHLNIVGKRPSMTTGLINQIQNKEICFIVIVIPMREKKIYAVLCLFLMFIGNENTK